MSTPFGVSAEVARPNKTSTRDLLRRTAVVVVALGGAALTVGVFGAMGGVVFCTCLSTAVLSGWLVSRVLRPSSKNGEMRENVSGRCVGWGSLVGALNAYPACLLTGLMKAGISPTLQEVSVSNLLTFVLVVGLIGLLVGTPLGLVFSSIYLFVVRKAQSLSHDGAIEGRDLLLRSAGSWLMVVAIGSFLFGTLFVSDGCHQLMGGRTKFSHLFVLSMGCVPAMLTGLVLFFVGRHGLHRRRVWFDRIVAGLERNWSIVEASEVDMEDMSDLAPLFYTPEFEAAVLMREIEGPESGAYRTGSEKIAWALVPRVDR